MTDGCPVCDWIGEVAHTYDSTHRYYTHIIVKNGETFTGKTCSMRTEPRKKGPVARVVDALQRE